MDTQLNRNTKKRLYKTDRCIFGQSTRIIKNPLYTRSSKRHFLRTILIRHELPRGFMVSCECLHLRWRLAGAAYHRDRASMNWLWKCGNAVESEYQSGVWFWIQSSCGVCSLAFLSVAIVTVFCMCVVINVRRA